MNARPALKHASLDTIEVRDDQFVFAGQKLQELAASVGRTPFYAYDSQSMRTRVEDLRRQLPDAIHLHYAIKANPMAEVVKHMAELVDGLDVASGGELAVALETTMNPSSISFAGPGKSEAELEYAITQNVVINVESETEIDRIVRLAEQTGKRPQIAIRVNPDFELKISGMKMSGGPKQFGIDSERVPGVLKTLQGLDLDFCGFHIFCGSQNLRPEAICEAQQKTVQLAIELSRSTEAPIRQLNIGGGFGIPYFPGEKPLDIAPIADNLDQLLPEIQAVMPDAEVILELGRYLVGESGIYVCRVVDRKLSRGQVFLITDGGLHHHLAASGNFGQVLRKNYPVLIGNRIIGDGTEIASVVGPLCTPLDLLADRMDLTRADIGDLIVVLQSGAYGLTASPTAFLSHPVPAQVFI
jgi:diaminopimelate decarboxylase